MSNIFSSLSRFAFRQEENFLTEALVSVLNVILEREKELGHDILGRISGELTKNWYKDAMAITVTTQFTVEEGRPDILIELGIDKLIFIEVKHDSGLGVEQLERYHKYLGNLIEKQTQLVLLTRSKHSVQETSLDVSLFHHVCWYEIGGWLSDADVQDEVTQYLVDQFLDFLKEKEMSMERITWEYMEGVTAMINLANMLGTAIAETLPEEKTRRTAGWNWVGYYIGDGTDIWIGIRYREPLIVVFENDNGNDPTYRNELYLPDVHFFSLTAGEQLECLIGFINSSLEEYKND